MEMEFYYYSVRDDMVMVGGKGRKVRRKGNPVRRQTRRDGGGEGGKGVKKVNDMTG